MLEFQRTSIPELAEHVAFVYRMHLDGSEEPDRRHTHLPNGTFEVILDLKGRAVHHGVSEAPRPQAFLGGMFNKLFHLRFSGPCDVVGAVLRPGAVHRYFDLPPDDLQCTLTPLEDLWSGASMDAIRAILEGKEHSDPMEELGRILRRVPRPGTYTPDPLMRAMAERTRRTGGADRIETLARKAHLSTRHFRRRFKAAIGMPAKEYGRLMRMNHFVRQCVSGGPGMSVVERAERCGYYDGSHLRKDLTRYLGQEITDLDRTLHAGAQAFFLASSPLSTSTGRKPEGPTKGLDTGRCDR
ncbi:MAG: AraC family transcriptional regulator [Flavobacteriales bacterium]|nr:AraC family transcriptional regulator [Flavobacteriales bacterium]